MNADMLVGLVRGQELKAWVVSLADQQREEQQQADCAGRLPELVSS